MSKRILLVIVSVVISVGIAVGQGTVRGNLFDKETGEPIMFGTVRILGTDKGTNTDLDGFFSIGSVPAGKYLLVASYIGYDSVAVDIKVRDKGIVYERLFLEQSAVELTTVNVNADREQARSDVRVSVVKVSPKQIKALPATGGEPDIAQYLPVLPGIIVSGDQGGQLYIRGGSPVQNKILLDGMTIYNPFHSIGFFSVFETETIKNVDVLTGGFNAEHGGRISAVVDIKTKEGNKKRLSGIASASPFQAKVLLEGPIKKFNPETGTSTSFLLTGKHSYLNETSKLLYSYATDTSFYSFAAQDTSLSDIGKIGLPYSYSDLYGKLSFIGGNGSNFNLFGFNFSDRFNFLGLADLSWKATGGGSNFTLVPARSDIVINGLVAYTKYDINLLEQNSAPRKSGINNYVFKMNFTHFGANTQTDYGFEIGGFNTDFLFTNSIGVQFRQKDFTTEIAGYAKVKKKIGDRVIFEPGIRLHYYASQPKLSVEPRVGLKINATDFLRFKFAGGLYSQNLISTVNEQDVVNFFVGFLAGPEEALYEPGTRTATKDRLQKSIHAIAGVEVDLTDKIQVNIEPYLKKFTQLISINRNKTSTEDPDFITETGSAYGIDFSLKYQSPDWYIWMTYSNGYVNRNDGEQVYPTIFDRRHNVNFLATYAFGSNHQWEASARWNLGSGFPFTKTKGFYQSVNFNDLLYTDILTGNYDLGTILSSKRNDGRLSWYHRLDLSLKRTFELGKYSRIEAVASITNAYNRPNVFYVNRITNSRVNQLPIIPSLAVTYKF